MKSKDFEMKKYKTRQEEKKERKKFESNLECDDEHENYKKHKYDPGRIMLTLITIVIKMNRNVFFLNGKNNKQKTKSNEKIK